MNTLLSLFWESTKIVRLITLITSLEAAIGIALRRHSPVGDINMLLSAAPWWVWSGTLFLVAVNRWWCLWYSPQCDRACISTIPAMLSSVAAIGVWSTLLVSAGMASDFGLALMIISCVLLEFWLLARVFTERLERKRLEHERAI